MKKVIVITAAAFMVAGLASCFKNPVTGRSSLNAVPESEMRTMAQQQYTAVLAESNVKSGTNDAEMIRRVGQKISAAATQYLSSIGKADLVSGYQWEYKLIESNQVNAWCMPGGKVAFYTGILPYCQGEAGIAVVMGHEIAHAIARHGNERISQQLAQQFGGVALSVLVSDKPAEAQNLFMGAYGLGTQVGVLLPFSRAHESEADEMGLIFMAMAGYDPHEAIGFWQRMATAGGQQPPEFLSTHPANDRRISDIRGKIPAAMKYYKPN